MGSSGVVLDSVLLMLPLGIYMFVCSGKEKCWQHGDNPVMGHKEGCRFLSILYRGEAEGSEVLAE